MLTSRRLHPSLGRGHGRGRRLLVTFAISVGLGPSLVTAIIGPSCSRTVTVFTIDDRRVTGLGATRDTGVRTAIAHLAIDPKVDWHVARMDDRRLNCTRIGGFTRVHRDRITVVKS